MTKEFSRRYTGAIGSFKPFQVKLNRFLIWLKRIEENLEAKLRKEISAGATNAC